MSTTPFRRDLVANLRKAVRSAKRQGTTAMSLENLLQVTTPPSGYIVCPHGPVTYRRLFREVAESTPEVRRFLLPEVTA